MKKSLAPIFANCLLSGLAYLVFIVVLSPIPVLAQEPVPVVKPNYEQAQRYSSRYLRQFVYDSSVRPHWIGKTEEFWYAYRTSDGTRYYRINPKHASKEELFDHSKLSALLSEELRKPLDSTRLPITRAEVDAEGKKLKFVVDRLQYEYDLDGEKLTKLGKPPASSPSSRFGSRGQTQLTEKKNEEEKDTKKDDEKETVKNKKDETKKTVEDSKSNTSQKTKKGTEQQKSGDQRKKDDKSKKNDDTKDDKNSGDKKDANQQKKTVDSKSDVTKKDVVKKSETKNVGDKKEGMQDNDESKTEDVKKTTIPKLLTDHRSFSPDRKAYVFAKGHDLYYVELPKDYKYEEPKEAPDEKKTNDESAESEKSTGKESDQGNAVGGKSKKKNDSNVTESKSSKNQTTRDAKKDDQDKTGETTKKKARKKRGGKKNSTTNKSRGKDESTVVDEDSKTDKKSRTKTQTSDQSKDSDKTTNAEKQGKNDDVKVDKQDEGEEDGDTKKDESDKAKDGEDKEDEKEKELPIPKIGPKLDDTAIRLSEDGEEKFSFSRRSRSRGSSSNSSTDQKSLDEAKTKKTRPSASWSKDSEAFYISRSDSREVKDLWVINSLSEPRPTLQKYSYPMPGETGVRTSSLHYFSRKSKKLTKVEPKWKQENYRNTHWKKEGHQLRFVRGDRLIRNVELCEVDIATGKVVCLIEDGFDAANISSQSVRYMKDSDEMIWWSERSGWGHFYLYGHDGKLKNPITSGEFRASRVLDVDEKNRLVYFYGNAREPDENVYQQHLYCVRFDGTGLSLLDPGDAYHRSTLSPSKKYVVDNCSRVDMQPVSILRDAQGNEVMRLEESDLSRLKEIGWKMPETFVVKAADGVTDLYGNIWKPFDFDPNKQYPIIAHVYPGPQMEGTSHTFSATVGDQQLAQLGFIVIQVGHRGGTPKRSKAYHTHGYYNLRDYGLADKKAAIEQLAQRFSYIDATRVGIYGHSGGGFMTAAALLREPYNEFFSVGVATSGNHDNNIYGSFWAERYHGIKEVAVKQKSDGSKKSTSDLTEGKKSVSAKSGSPQSAGNYSAFDVDESDFFYEHEGYIDEDGQLEWSSGHDRDGPEVFSRRDQENQDKKRQEESDKTKNDLANKGQDSKSKNEDSNTSKSDSDSDKSKDAVEKSDSQDKKKTSEDTKKEAEQKTRFEIEVPTNAELAENLKGHLFLIHGESDNNVHPANTLRLVDALITANKRFDMLYLPGTRHSFGKYQPYVTQRMYEYFAEHLLDDYQSSVDLSDRK